MQRPRLGKETEHAGAPRRSAPSKGSSAAKARSKAARVSRTSGWGARPGGGLRSAGGRKEPEGERLEMKSTPPRTSQGAEDLSSAVTGMEGPQGLPAEGPLYYYCEDTAPGARAETRRRGRRLVTIQVVGQGDHGGCGGVRRNGQTGRNVEAEPTGMLTVWG